MTPKEKALQLVDKFCFGLYPWQIKRAKQCALICVDELLNELKWLNNYEDKDRVEYWQEVKQEIKKL